jgi:hypothetical protein
MNKIFSVTSATFASPLGGCLHGEIKLMKETTMIKLFGREWTKSELIRRVGRMDQLAGISLTEAADGKAQGSRLLDVWTGSGLRFQVNAERALDIVRCEYQGQALAWRSMTGDVHPAYAEQPELGWLRSFAGGLLVTCGLDQYGLPARDGENELGLHGRISNLPAAQLAYRTAWVGEEYRLEISGEVRQTRVFGENLVLQRRISTALGSNRIRIEDSVTNEGFEPCAHMLLYHFNLGFPLVSADTCLKVRTAETLARNADAELGLGMWDHFQDPTSGYREQVFIHRPAPDADGMTSVELANPALSLAVRWRYPAAQLPYLMEWKMMGEGMYAVGVEPSNCSGLAGRPATRALGQLPQLEPGESKAYQIDLEVIG